MPGNLGHASAGIPSDCENRVLWMADLFTGGSALPLRHIQADRGPLGAARLKLLAADRGCGRENAPSRGDFSIAGGRGAKTSRDQDAGMGCCPSGSCYVTPYLFCLCCFFSRCGTRLLFSSTISFPTIRGIPYLRILPAYWQKNGPQVTSRRLAPAKENQADNRDSAGIWSLR